MRRRLSQIFAAALLCGAVGVAGPSFAAGAKHATLTHHAVTRHAIKHATMIRAHSNAMPGADAKERAITTQLNRQSLANSNQAELQTAMPMVASVESDDDSE